MTIIVSIVSGTVKVTISCELSHRGVVDKLTLSSFYYLSMCIHYIPDLLRVYLTYLDCLYFTIVSRVS